MSRGHQPMGGSVLSLQPTRRPDGGDGWTLCSHYLSFSPHTRPLTTTKQQLKTNLSSLNISTVTRKKNFPAFSESFSSDLVNRKSRHSTPDLQNLIFVLLNMRKEIMVLKLLPKHRNYIFHLCFV